MNGRFVPILLQKSVAAEGAILQVSVPTLAPGGCWATAGADRCMSDSEQIDSFHRKQRQYASIGRHST